MPQRRRMVDEHDPQFRRFWEAYPRRCAKLEARRAWADLNPSAALVDTMCRALVWQCQQPNWRKDGGAYIPHPASWLRAARWEDEPTPLRQMSEAAELVFRTLRGDTDGV